MTYKTIIIWKVHKLRLERFCILGLLFWFYILGHYLNWITDMTFTFWLTTIILITYYLLFGKYIYPTILKRS